MTRSHYPIGTPGKPWTDDDKRTWFQTQTIKRSYQDEVLTKLTTLDDAFDVFRYGALPIDENRYPLMAVRVLSSDDNAPWALISGGVHGYETSGVQGALAFLKNHALDYKNRVNLLVLPCVSPWGYEVIHRWNPNAIDPNRSFIKDSPSEEAAAFIDVVKAQNQNVLMHIDLHETTDTDESEFRPALAAREGLVLEPGTIPDGFYTVADSENPQPEFQAAIIAGVQQVTHIAPADHAGQIIGADVTGPGVIDYAFKKLGLCAGVTNAPFTTTTEVYPDSPTATPEICIEAQVAAIKAGLDFALAEHANI